jgi:dTDP-4-dehydrorhamnose 3,5-epimerase
MLFTETRLRGAFIVDIEEHVDSRGFFARTFCQHEFAAHNLNPLVAQTNIAFNKSRGTLRGMHFQMPPTMETKLVRVTHGAVLDVVIDLRPESETYLQHVSVELTAANRRALYVPVRFAHGYQVLQDDTEVTYEMGDFYTPDGQGGLRYDDPSLGLVWPLPISVVSAKDSAWPLLAGNEPELRAKMNLHNALSAEPT